MAAILALLAGLVATGFLVRLGSSYRSRPRPHLAAWTVAILMYALATWALFAGLALGWSSAVFKAFYYFGAIVNVPFLALGSVYLVLGARVGRVLLSVFAAFGLAAAVVTVRAGFVEPLPAEGLPSGREVLTFFGPRIWALAGNVVGTVLLLGLALYTIVRFWRSNRRLVGGNVLIVLGVLAPAVAGTVEAFVSLAAAFAASLFIGAALLWAGFEVASGARVRSSERPGGGPAPPAGPP
ncbi:MAG: hypothetical protein ACRDXD_13250, partial [Acidimicrobiia bacterium]